MYGIAPSSSGGTTVGGALRILGTRQAGRTRVDALHDYLEASAIASADRNRQVADPAFVKVPQYALLSRGSPRNGPA